MEPPGWMIAPIPASSAIAGPSANGKNASRGEHRALERVAVLAGLLDGDAHRVDAAHLAGADAEGLAVAGEHDRVRELCLTTVHAKRRSSQAGVGELAADDVHLVERVGLAVAVLHEQAAEHPPQVPLGRVEARAAPSLRIRTVGFCASASTATAS